MTKAERNDLLTLMALVGLLLVPTFLLVGGGFYYGKWYESHRQHQTPAQICEECRAGGERAGLNTCSDVLQKADENGNY